MPRVSDATWTAGLTGHKQPNVSHLQAQSISDCASVASLGVVDRPLIMFSPDASVHTHSLRPKRNRQAAGNDDSVKLPQAKRKRSALKRDTFVEPLAEASLNEIAGRENVISKTNGHVSDGKAPVAAPSTQSKELSIRGSKKSDKRSERGPGALTLASNDFYNVTQLPSLPDQIRSRPSVPYTCLLSPEHGYAVALTHTEALIWPYNSSTTTPSSRDIISFKLPLPPASAADPLPLATLTARSAGGKPGILVVSPKWGKIVYWETITNASTFVPGQTSVGVQGSVPGMLSGETVQELINAEPAGFVLTFSHGRLAHLSVRDQLGRPAIGVQFLRKSHGSTSGSIFGTIKNAFGMDRRKGTPMVRPGNATKGQRDVVVMTEDAGLEVWDTNIGAGHSLVSSIDFKDTLLEALTPQVEEAQAQPLQFKILDFEHAKTRQEIARKDQPPVMPLVVLLSMSGSGQSQYYLVEISVIESTVNIRAVHPVKCYSAPVSEVTSWRPRLSVSMAQSMAFIVFDTALILFSLAKIRESPSSQLLMEKQALPDPFQDCIRFQEDAIYRVLGYTSEDYGDQAALLLSVQAFGLVRVVSNARANEDIDVDEIEERISAKSKIEQAVFFGTIKQNPLNLTTMTHNEFSAEEISKAALEISSEILSSTSKFLPRGGPSADLQMKLRAKALDDLMQHLMKQYGSLVSRNLRYKLLWNAEKLAAAQATWKVQEDIQRRYPLQDREMSYLDFTLRALHETRQKYPDEDKGEKDRVRHWLLNSVEKIDHLLSELVDCVGELHPMDVTDPRIVGEYLCEASDLWTAAYAAAFKFREDNASSYGLDDDIFEDGVVVAGYPPSAGLPWTSKPEPIQYAAILIEHICTYLTEWWDHSPESAKAKKKKMPTDTDGKPHAAPPRALLDDLSTRLPSEVRLFNGIVTEEIINAIRHLEFVEKDPFIRQQKAAGIRAEKRPRMTDTITHIATFNPRGAIELAERLKDPGLLVSLTTDYLLFLDLDAKIHPENALKNKRKIEQVQGHAETYYERFGNGWAYANFSRKVDNGELGTLLIEGQTDAKKQGHLTWFLKKCLKRGQRVGKLSWINDVVGENNFTRAEKALSEVAETQETEVWSQKTELSLAKLANLAGIEAKLERQPSLQLPDHSPALKQYDQQMALIDIQDQLSNHVEFAVGATIDMKAAEDLAIQIFAKRIVEKMPALRKLLISGLRGLVNKRPLSAEQLVDILTLMDPFDIDIEEGSEEDPGILGYEFHYALLVLETADLSGQHKQELRKVIWRRAMIRDDWNVLNNTTDLTDEEVDATWQQTSIFRTLTQLFDQDQTTPPSEDKANVAEMIVSPEEILDTTNNDATTVDADHAPAAGKANTALGDVLPSLLAQRFYGDDKERDAVKKDLAKEQGRLRDYVEKAQLALHFSGLLSNAERMVRGDDVDLQGAGDA